MSKFCYSYCTNYVNYLKVDNVILMKVRKGNEIKYGCTTLSIDQPLRRGAAANLAYYNIPQPCCDIDNKGIIFQSHDCRTSSERTNPLLMHTDCGTHYADKHTSQESEIHLQGMCTVCSMSRLRL